MDTFICGTCETVYYELCEFVKHKNTGCFKVVEAETGQKMGDAEPTKPSADEADACFVSFMDAPPGAAGQDVDMVGSVNGALESFEERVRDRREEVETCGASGETNQGLHLLSAMESVNPVGKILSQNFVIGSEWPAAVTTRRKPYVRQKKTARHTEVSMKQDVPLQVDGKLKCDKCGLSFSRERHWKSHKCEALSEFVGYSPVKCEGATDDDGFASSDGKMKRIVIASKKLVRRRRPRHPKIANEVVPNEVVANSVTETQQEIASELPVFNNDQERKEFEENLQVDLSSYDHLFQKYSINDNNSGNGPSSQKELTIFSCRVCKRVMDCQSVARLHVIIHTKEKPFKCCRCSYATNVKGNLYTHYRKHSRQVYKCSHCKFSSANRCHVVEHELIHTSERIQCRLCRSYYSTVKSLTFHIRRYHHTAAGREYLQSFRTRISGKTMTIHQCHLCNRKFKKKQSYNHHVKMHSECNGIARCFVCLCDIKSQQQLASHLKTHPHVYVCKGCNGHFASQARLSSHILKYHNKDAGSSLLFNESLKLTLVLRDDCKEASETTAIDLGLSVESPEMSLISLAMEVADAIDRKQVLTAGESEFCGDVQTSVALENVKTQEGKQTALAESQESRQTALAESQEGKQTALAWKKDEDNKDISKSDQFEKITDPKIILERIGFTEIADENVAEIHSLIECAECGKIFCEKDDLERHSAEHKGTRLMPNISIELSVRQLADDVTPCPGASRVQCPVCKEFVALGKAFLKHLNTHDSSVDASCILCGLDFASKLEYQKHMKQNHKKQEYLCKFCGKSFRTAGVELRQHIWQHEGIKPRSCPLCPYKCREKANLVSHMIRHTNAKPLNCHKCSKSYKSITALRAHQQWHSTGSLFKCSRCPYEAIQKCHLRRHLETHQVIKKFQCRLCEFSANTPAYMKVHYTKQHKGQSYNPARDDDELVASSDIHVFRCLACDYLFGNVSDLKRHLAQKHKILQDQLGELSNFARKSSNTAHVIKFKLPSEVESPLPSSIPGNINLGENSQSSLPSEVLITEELPNAADVSHILKEQPLACPEAQLQDCIFFETDDGKTIGIPSSSITNFSEDQVMILDNSISTFGE